MAKKIYFKNVNTATVNTLNTIAEIVFVSAKETAILNTEKRTLTKELELLEAAATLGDSGSDEIQNHKNKLNVIAHKKKALSAFRKNTLYGYKDSNDKRVLGHFEKLGITSDLFETYQEAVSTCSFSDWNTAIKNLLKDTFAMNLNEKLTKQLADYLIHSIGLKKASSTKIRQGKLVDTVNKNNFNELFVFALIDYMSDTCESLVVPNEKVYSVITEYDENYKELVNYQLVEAGDNKDSKSAKKSTSKNKEKVVA